jgi:hypothetical protein
MALNCLCAGLESNCDVARGKDLVSDLRDNMMKDDMRMEDGIDVGRF